MNKLVAGTVVFTMLAGLCFAEAGAVRRPERGAKPSKDEVIPFYTTVRVEVAATGEPTKIEASPELPEVVRTYIEKRLSAWQYEPAKVAGAPASAVTYVRVGGCAVPVPEGLRLGVDFKGNGPALEGKSSWLLTPPEYPPDLARREAEGTFLVTYAIQGDGRTRVESIEPQTPTKEHDLKRFKIALTNWIEGIRYQPELVNGEGFETRHRVPVVFSLSDEIQEFDVEKVAHVNSARECQMAQSEPGLTPLALDSSPVKVTPSPSG